MTFNAVIFSSQRTDHADRVAGEQPTGGGASGCFSVNTLSTAL
jgi:hypothetical protein